MKYKVSIAVNAWLEEEVEAASPGHAAQRMMHRVDRVTQRLQAAGVDWLTVCELDDGDIIVTDEAGDEHEFVADYDGEHDAEDVADG